MSGKPITWWELQVPDMQAAKAFYGGVFGWTFQPWKDGYETVQDADGEMIGGLGHRDGDAAGRHIHVVFSADAGEDTLEQLLERVERHGGKIVTDRTRIAPDMGWYATVQDPSGLTFDLSTTRPAA